MQLKRILLRMTAPHKYSSEAYIRYIRKSGGKIGESCYIYSPETVSIDMARPYLIDIGDNVIITKNVSILTHDYSHTVLRKKYGQNIGDSKGVKIGSNVFIGIDALILMGTTIGSNVIIGAKSVVRGVIPDNVVVAGNPARIVCTLDEHYKKKQEECLQCALNQVKLCKKQLNRIPTVEEMGDAFAWLYLPRNKETIEAYPGFFNLPGENKEAFVQAFMQTRAQFDSYDAFISYAENELKEENRR